MVLAIVVGIFLCVFLFLIWPDIPPKSLPEQEVGYKMKSEIKEYKMFTIDDNELKKYNSWTTEHNKVCPLRSPDAQGAIGGRITYTFTPTSLGVIAKVMCACGESIDLTNYDW